MKPISKIILPSLIAGASLVGCVNQGEFKAPNLGAVDVSLYTEEDRIIQGRAMDVDNDEKVDGVFADALIAGNLREVRRLCQRGVRSEGTLVLNQVE